MQEHGIDIILASTQPNVEYFADYFRPIGTEYDMLWHPDATQKSVAGVAQDPSSEPFLVLAGHEQTAAASADIWIKDVRFWGPGYYLKNWTEPNPPAGNPMNETAQAIKDRGLETSTIGVNMRFLGPWYLDRLKEHLPQAKFVNSVDAMWEIRRVKTPEEISRTREACRRTAKVWKRVMDSRVAGMSEKEIQVQMTQGFFEEELTNLRPWAWNGPSTGSRLKNGAAIPGANRLEEGMVTRVDVHGSYKGYTSDMARVVAFGKCSSEMERAHDLIRTICTRLHAEVGPGMRCKDLRKMELEMYEGTGYHTEIPYTGHHMGKAVHEPPFINEYEEMALQPNTIISIEPTILFSENGGDIFVALEDTVLITERGSENLSGIAPWDLYH